MEFDMASVETSSNSHAERKIDSRRSSAVNDGSRGRDTEQQERDDSHARDDDDMAQEVKEEQREGSPPTPERGAIDYVEDIVASSGAAVEAGVDAKAEPLLGDAGNRHDARHNRQPSSSTNLPTNLPMGELDNLDKWDLLNPQDSFGFNLLDDHGSLSFEQMGEDAALQSARKDGSSRDLKNTKNAVVESSNGTTIVDGANHSWMPSHYFESRGDNHQSYVDPTEQREDNVCYDDEDPFKYAFGEPAHGSRKGRSSGKGKSKRSGRRRSNSTGVHPNSSLSEPSKGDGKRAKKRKAPIEEPLDGHQSPPPLPATESAPVTSTMDTAAYPRLERNWSNPADMSPGRRYNARERSPQWHHHTQGSPHHPPPPPLAPPGHHHHHHHPAYHPYPMAPPSSGDPGVHSAFLPPLPPTSTQGMTAQPPPTTSSNNEPPREIYIGSKAGSSKPPPPPPAQRGTSAGVPSSAHYQLNPYASTLAHHSPHHHHHHPPPPGHYGYPPPTAHPQPVAKRAGRPSSAPSAPAAAPSQPRRPQATGVALLTLPDGRRLSRTQAPGIGWPADEDLRLTEVMSNHKSSQVNWERLAQELGGNRTARECHDRWTRYLKPGSRKGQWREEEDAIVLRVIFASTGGANPSGEGGEASAQHPPFTQWADLAPQLPGRTGKQIRDRWVNYLNPAINHLPFSREDDLMLWRGHKELGKRWVEISVKVFQSTRSENHIKNRWYSAAFKKFIAKEFGMDAYLESKQAQGGVVATVGTSAQHHHHGHLTRGVSGSVVHSNRPVHPPVPPHHHPAAREVHQHNHSYGTRNGMMRSSAV